jgi:transitional endoplasmic reticulum ATPase
METTRTSRTRRFTFEEGVLAGYLANYLRLGFRARSTIARHNLEWFLENRGGALIEGAEWLPEARRLLQNPHREPSAEGPPQDDVGALVRRSIIPHFEAIGRGNRRRAPSALEANLRTLSRGSGLDANDQAIFGLLVRCNLDPAVNAFCENVQMQVTPAGVLSFLLGMSVWEVKDRLNGGSLLGASGLLDRASRVGPPTMGAWAGVREAVLAALDGGDGTAADLHRRVLGEPRAPRLEWEDFEHLGEVREKMVACLSRSVAQGSRGLNVLLYGPPGTGKTEFAATLAARLGLSLYPAGESDEKGGEPDRRDRLGALRLSQVLLRRRRDAMVLFDEMDDAFGPTRGRGGEGVSKVFANRLLEENPVPTVWIVNDPSILNGAFIRRMGFALEMKIPPTGARKRVWERILAHHGVSLPEADVADLARGERVAPALVESAVRFAAMTGGSTDDIRAAAGSIVRAMAGPGVDAFPREDELFEAGLVRADFDLSFLEARLTERGAGRAFSLCLPGPPGTGKSAFVRHLAGRMGMEVLQKRASDLLGPLVGLTEANIAAAFREAREEGLFLVLDEADSLLTDRKAARQSWQVSQVNEMLSWMERHPLPLACTTNLMDCLDEASLRRFTFKVRFDFLGPGQVEEAFRFFFGQAPPARVRALRNLTPGDFAVARRKAGFLGLLGNPAELVSCLEGEAAVKRCTPRAVGFAPP